MKASEVLFVGEMNPYGTKPEFALYHLPREAAGNRLREILGLSDADYEKLAKVNLCVGKWTNAVARQKGQELLRHSDYKVIVGLGEKVRWALGGPEPFLLVSVASGLTVVTLPHPSGRCRTWNRPDSRQLARQVMRAAAPNLPWGNV